ncbi:YheC/YheD family protein [Paenibacillus lentus]|uniref:YheC/YheD family protein n=1 Tax=Paenibacillus lentus TaxID=1338368 RepID=A0A3Q8S3X8_9BACL|nr:YheC/YheD family protein [Paenibacillus lentus]AZK45573.1 YheC/YheD family protein [Paenibacillus lentus]
MAIQRVASKWEKTKALHKKEHISLYIPETRKYSIDQMQEMLDTYELVYIKPDRGTYGIGVMCADIWRDDIDEDAEPKFRLQFGTQSEIHPNIESLHQSIEEKIGTKPYLIQKGISLLTYKRRKFDIRALVQKTPNNTWETTAFIGRIAAPHRIVTNHHSGGSVLPIEDLLGPYLTPSQFLELYKEMKNLGVHVASELSRKYPRLKEIGLDLAIDEQYHIWILEVNTKPALFPFKWLQDKSIYKKVRRYAVAYGRLKSAK